MYWVAGLSIVVDSDGLAKDDTKTQAPGENYKYLILQPDCKLYSQWDDPASLVF